MQYFVLGPSGFIANPNVVKTADKERPATDKLVYSKQGQDMAIAVQQQKYGGNLIKTLSYDDENLAQAVAQEMATKNPGETFTLLYSYEAYKAEVAPPVKIQL